MTAPRDTRSPLSPLALATFDAAKLAKVNLHDSSRWFVDVWGLEPGQAQKPHRHDDADKLYFALEGEGEVTLDGRTHPLRRGELAICEAGVEHGVANRGATRLVLLVAMTRTPA
jgi:quercetin dioxygenase-like cupin family protein